MDSSVFFSSSCVYWNTPPDLYRDLDNRFHFTLDPCGGCCSLAPFSYYEQDDGLSQPWFGSVYVNPPYKDIDKWLRKGIAELYRTSFIVFLLPVRTDTKWFHDLVFPYAYEIHFIRGRLHFNGSKNPAPFPSMYVVFKGGEPETEVFDGTV